ncbi:Fatty acid desaturase 5 isoform 1 [Sesbania bispinosa]|nr:Fatty acid desaturase 5 isoform 1 [Sesbania bispinosa]
MNRERTIGTGSLSGLVLSTGVNGFTLDPSLGEFILTHPDIKGNPIDWVSTHRYHHQFCDSDKDPHSPIEGFWFSHMSWLFDTTSVIEKCGEQTMLVI